LGRRDLIYQSENGGNAMLTRIAAAIVAACALGTPAQAEPSVNHVLTMLKGADGGDAELMKIYVTGVEAGIGYANALAANQGRPFYCQPEISLTVDQAADIAARLVVKKPEIGASSFGSVMIFALVDAFPCASPSRSTAAHPNAAAFEPGSPARALQGTPVRAVSSAPRQRILMAETARH
jgi:hypothetical protein